MVASFPMDDAQTLAACMKKIEKDNIAKYKSI
jgi:hypothetical protein